MKLRISLVEKLQSFKPIRIQEAFESVKKQHTYLKGVDEGLTTNLIAQVRQLLQETKNDHLPKLANSFSPKQLRATLHILAHDEDSLILNKGLTVVVSRPRKSMLTFGWRLLKKSYPAEFLETAIRTLGMDLGWEAMAGDPEALIRYQHWFSSLPIVPHMIADLAVGTDSDLDKWLVKVGVEANSNLASVVWTEILTNGGKKLYDQLGHLVVLQKALGRTKIVQKAFGRNYLTRLKFKDLWFRAVLEWVRDEFGVPKRTEASFTSFWRDVPEAVRREFRKWSNEKQLRQFFQHDHERLNFWKNFQGEMEFVDDALKGEALLIDFGSFGVAEFLQTGNAAYVYPSQAFQRLINTSARVRWAVELKDPDSTLQGYRGGPNGDGRIIHSGHWQERYGNWISDLIRRG